MDVVDDETLSLFVEDTREHLRHIESALMDLERGGAAIEDELVNTIFRAAHSIKGGAAFLGLENMRNLAHKLESILHMIRSREIVPETRIVNLLLAGFDRLLALADDIEASDKEDVSDLIAALADLAEAHLTGEQKAQAASRLAITAPDGRTAFTEDELSLRQAVSGGKLLYLVEYDLIHDVHARGKTPLDVITTMETSGLIVDFRLDLSSVGDLDAPPTNRLPFFVLYATIVEPDIVSYLFALDPRRIHQVDLEAMSCCGRALADAEPPAEEATFGAFAVSIAGGAALVTLADGASPEAADAKSALLFCLDNGLPARLDLDGLAEAGAGLLQLVVSAAMTFSRRGLSLTLAGDSAPVLARTAARAGVTGDSLTAVGLSPTFFSQA